MIDVRVHPVTVTSTFLVGGFVGLTLLMLAVVSPNRDPDSFHRPPPLPLGAATAPGKVPTATYAARFGGDLLWPDTSGRIRAWNAATGKPDAVMAKRLGGPLVQRLGASGDTLFALSGADVLRWSPPHGWKPAFKTSGDLSAVLALVVVKDRPVLLLRDGAIDLATERRHPLPRGLGRVLTVHASGEWIWFGRSDGEFGGEMAGLDLATGEWFQATDDLHYVTGFSTSPAGELLVSWSMSHFEADALIRAYRLGAVEKPREVIPVQEDLYVQTLATLPEDGQLYAVEQQRVVRVVGKALEEVATFTPIRYPREPQAMGAAPGVKELIPISPTAFWVIPFTGEPQFVAMKPKVPDLAH